MQNPWKKLPENPPFILDIDKNIIDKHNKKSKSKYQIVDHMYPEPYLGRHSADIVLLNLNPGFGGEEDLKNHKMNKPFIELLKKNLVQEELEYPFIFLDPTISDTSGYKWWNTRLRTLIEKVGRKKLAKSLLCLEFFPYHSKKYNFKELVNSQRYSFYLLEEAIKRDAFIISFRSFSKWSSAVPELQDYKHLYHLNSPQNVYFTKNNCPEGYDATLNKLQASTIE
jgi:hypothetical protein